MNQFDVLVVCSPGSSVQDLRAYPNMSTVLGLLNELPELVQTAVHTVITQPGKVRLNSETFKV